MANVTCVHVPYGIGLSKKSAPPAEELDTVAHVGRGLESHDLEYPAHLLAHRVMLLAREQHARVIFAFCQVLRVKAKEVSAVEALEDTISARGKPQMLFVGPPNHAGFLRCDHVYPTRPQRLHQAAIPGIFIDIQPKHQAARWRASNSKSNPEAVCGVVVELAIGDWERHDDQTCDFQPPAGDPESDL